MVDPSMRTLSVRPIQNLALNTLFLWKGCVWLKIGPSDLERVKSTPKRPCASFKCYSLSPEQSLVQLQCLKTTLKRYFIPCENAKKGYVRLQGTENVLSFIDRHQMRKYLRLSPLDQLKAHTRAMNTSKHLN